LERKNGQPSIEILQCAFGGNSVAIFRRQNEENEGNEDFEGRRNRMRSLQLGQFQWVAQNAVSCFTRKKSQVQIL